MRRLDYATIWTDEESATKWALDHGLLNQQPKCFKCEGDTKWSEKRQVWYCRDRKCNRITSLTSRTLFDNIRSIRTFLLLMYEWCSETTIKSASYEYHLTPSAVSKIYKKIRALASLIYFESADVAIGGPGETVEIDECLLAHSKYYRGRVLSGQIWVFGGITRGNPLECFIEIVKDRSQDTLIEVIKRRIRPGSTISSDGWRGYRNLIDLLPEHDFESHKVVNHSKNFVNPEDSEAHTQSIESFWAVFKRHLKKLGFRKIGGNVNEYFGEVMYRKSHPFGFFEEFVSELNFLYQRLRIN